MHGAALHFIAELLGGAVQHGGQLTGLLTQACEHSQQAGKAFLLRQCHSQRRSFAHLHQGVERIGTHGAVGQGVGSGLQGFEDRHASPGEHGQRAGKTGPVITARQFSEYRHGQPGGIKLFTKSGPGPRQTCTNSS